MVLILCCSLQRNVQVKNLLKLLKGDCCMEKLEDSKIEFSKYAKFLKNTNSVIIINGHSGVWGEIENDLFNKVKYCIDNRIDLIEYMKSFGNIEERKQLEEVFDALLSEEMLVKSKNDIKIDIKDVEFKMTNKCNLSCIHCGASSDIHNKDILSTEEMKHILDKIFELNIDNLYLTGGEPLIRKDINIILKYIGENFNGEVRLLTNGTFIDMDMAKLLRKYVNAVSISVDGWDEKSSEFVRGKGTFKKVLSAISNLKGVGFDKETIILTMTCIYQNNNHKEEFYEFCKKLNVTGAVRQFSAFGRGYENYEKIGVKNHLIVDSNLESQIEDIKEELECKIFCRAGIGKLMINEKGDIYPCLVLEYDDYKFGNVLNDGLREMVQSENYKNLIEKIFKETPVDSKEHCKNCKVRYFCMDRCLGVSRSYYDNEDICEERCNQMRDYLNRVIWEN